MTLYVNGIEKEITLKSWNGNQWSPDMFYDLECNVPDGSEVTAERYQEIIDYWQSEVDTYNDGGWSEQFGDQTESTVKEYGFWYDDLEEA